jgi:hypothetical protein
VSGDERCRFTGDPSTWPPHTIIGRWQDENGYVKLRLQFADHVVRISEHRYIMGNPPGMDVHHKNEIKGDNHQSNLENLTPAEHRRQHPEIARVGGLAGGATNRRLAATDPAWREQQAEYGRQSRENWRARCEADPSLRELNRAWASKAGRSHNSWGRVPADLAERIRVLDGQGLSPGAIARLLTSEGIPTPRGRSKSWGRTTVMKVIEATR